MPEVLPTLPILDLAPQLAAPVTAPLTPDKTAGNTAELEFAAIVDELLGGMAPSAAPAVGALAGTPEPASEPPATTVADGNSLPPTLPLALPFVPAAPEAEPVTATVAADLPNPRPTAASAAPTVATSALDARPIALLEAASAPPAPGTSPAALTELAPALPTTETALTVAREAIAMAADRLVPSTAAPSPTTPDLAAAAAAGPNPSPPGSTVQSPGRLLEVPVPVQHEQWGEALGNRVVWLANRQVQSAELHLNPPELGPVEVQIRMSDKQATLEFSAAQPLVREAIESALPKLREMFSAHGLDLADVNVSQQSPSQSRGEHGTHAAAPGRFAAPDGEPASEPQGQSTPQRLGLVDLYA